jgi:hypothetical protein
MNIMRKITSLLLLLFFTLIYTIPAYAQVGTGVLWVYTDTWGGTEASKEQNGNYLVLTEETYYIRIMGVTEVPTGSKVIIKIGWTDTNDVQQTEFFNDVPVLEDSGVRYIDVPAWTTPSSAQICTTSTVHYVYDHEYVSAGQMSSVGHTHFVVPEVPLGSLGSLVATVIALYVYMRAKRV